jgi:hypothetical protein
MAAYPPKSRFLPAARPVTIKMIRESTQTGEGIWTTACGLEMASVTVVGRILEVHHPNPHGQEAEGVRHRRPQYQSIYLSDGSGWLCIRRWLSSSNLQDPQLSLELGEYASVSGSLRMAENGEGSYLAASVLRTPIKSNAIMVHFLQAIHLHCRLGLDPSAIHAQRPSTVAHYPLGSTGMAPQQSIEITQLKSKVNRVRHREKSEDSTGTGAAYQRARSTNSIGSTYGTHPGGPAISLVANQRNLSSTDQDQRGVCFHPFT